MFQAVDLSSLAENQSVPLMDDITLRYDAGQNASGDPVVFMVIDTKHLCQLPTDLLSGLGVGADREDRLGDPTFFVGDESCMKLIVDTDAFPSFKADLIDISEEHGIRLVDAIGDLKMLCGDNGDIGIPDMPAYVHAGMERIDTQVALSALEDERREFKEGELNGPGSQLL